MPSLLFKMSTLIAVYLNSLTDSTLLHLAFARLLEVSESFVALLLRYEIISGISEHGQKDLTRRIS